MKSLIIFDLDGTLADCEHRRHFVATPPKDWAAFHAACVDDQPMPHTAELIRLLYSHCNYSRQKIWIVTGRCKSYQAETMAWLSLHQLPHHALLMREEGDHTEDVKLKRQWAKKFDFINRAAMVFEDRQRVVDMWRGLGVPCLQVAPGDF